MVCYVEFNMAHLSCTWGLWILKEKTKLLATDDS